MSGSWIRYLGEGARTGSRDESPLWASGIPLRRAAVRDRVARLPVRKVFGLALTILAFAFLVAVTAFPVRIDEGAFAFGTTAAISID